jgi:hypothetical protein
MAINKACEHALNGIDLVVLGEIEKAMNKINAII